MRAALALFISLVVSLLLPGSLRAESGADLVAILTSEPRAALTRRVRSELEALGVDVIVLRPPAEASAGMRAPLEQAARSVGAIAAIRLVVSSEGKVEVWVADRVTGKALVRELDATGTQTSDAEVAIGTVELLRASLMELHAADPPHGEVNATKSVAALALPVSPPRLAIPRLGISVGGGAELSFGELGPSSDASLRIWARLANRIGLVALGHATLSPARVDANGGTIEITRQLLGAGLAWDLADAKSTWVPALSFGSGAAHVSVNGSADPPLVGTRDAHWYWTPFASAGVGFAFASGLRLRADAVAIWSIPKARITSSRDEEATWAHPSLIVSLGFETLWIP